MNLNGTIFDISRFCLHDGPGIRTTVFLKGCPLRCKWCHNPESQHLDKELMYNRKECINCGKCSFVCPNSCHSINDIHKFNRSLCIGCGKCVGVCPVGALRMAGKTSSAEEIINEVLKDKTFYKESGGGMTVSGGEPLMQPEFLEKLLILAKENKIHTCIETCGFASEKVIRKIAPLTDCFLFDWKEGNPEKHKFFTGVDNAVIRRNLEILDKLGAEIILRLPLIPECNNTTEHINSIANLANKHKNIRRVDIMPYHLLGTSKADELGLSENVFIATVPSVEMLDSFKEELKKRTNLPIEICL